MPLGNQIKTLAKKRQREGLNYLFGREHNIEPDIKFERRPVFHTKREEYCDRYKSVAGSNCQGTKKKMDSAKEKKAIVEAV